MTDTKGGAINELLGEILEAHGGLERWNQYRKVEATIVSGGGLFPLKGVPQDSSPRRMTVWLHDERSSVFTTRSPGPHDGAKSNAGSGCIRQFSGMKPRR